MKKYLLWIGTIAVLAALAYPVWAACVHDIASIEPDQEKWTLNNLTAALGDDGKPLELTTLSPTVDYCTDNLLVDLTLYDIVYLYHPGETNRCDNNECLNDDGEEESCGSGHPPGCTTIVGDSGICGDGAMGGDNNDLNCNDHGGTTEMTEDNDRCNCTCLNDGISFIACW